MEMQGNPEDMERRIFLQISHRNTEKCEKETSPYSGRFALDDLRVPPGNRLHPLKGDRTGQHSISINDQWRICFRWRDGNAFDVEIADYH